MILNLSGSDSNQNKKTKTNLALLKSPGSSAPPPESTQSSLTSSLLGPGRYITGNGLLQKATQINQIRLNFNPIF